LDEIKNLAAKILDLQRLPRVYNFCKSINEISLAAWEHHDNHENYATSLIFIASFIIDLSSLLQKTEGHW
jgi:hypothetical protein